MFMPGQNIISNNLRGDTLTQGNNKNDLQDIAEKKVSAASVSDRVAEKDSLGFQPYVSAIAEFLTNDKTKPPLTLSIEGEWGSGKSSFMKQLQQKLEERDKKNQKTKLKIVWFNARVSSSNLV